MSDGPSDIILRAIGAVRNEIKQPPQRGHDWNKTVSDIVIDDNLSEALDGLEEFSHIIVLFWIHKAGGRQPATRVHPQGRQELPLVGLFATRSPHRPNPIGKTTVKLIKRQGNTLKVAGLDAIDGTPVIDIKPYIPGHDSADDAEVPSWIANL